jgi:phosphatidylinositol phospholipase C epsilon
MRLTEVEYELFKQVHPIEYLRHATLDMNNFKYSLIANSVKQNQPNNSNLNDETQAQSCESKGAQASTFRTVQDLIVRYKEVSSWIKKLIQSQPTSEKRLAIILSAIRCAITCWNIGNFNSAREIWLGLK